ncbi:response regulator [Arenimonas sp.]|uniref:response regulator n=1 Tax=Arenimonas sp. TaxID=1872635 RepID=UPI0035B32838
MNPRLLLLEDDPVSAAFLAQGLASLPASVETVATLAAARDAARHGDHALWLFDLRLPDGRGEDLLAELRAAGLRVPAVALSADPAPGLAGFARVLAKPLGLHELLEAVRDLLPPEALPPWDDTAGLAAVAGQAAALATLRAMFREELPSQCRAVQAACRDGDADAARAHLHRLKAGCGFVGALPLLAAVRALHEDPGDALALARFEACVERALEAG